MYRPRLALFLTIATVLGCRDATAQSYDPPARVGRISFATGSLSLLLAGESDWRDASLNYPLTTGDELWTDNNARGEVHIGASALHLAPGTSLVLDAVQDNLVQLRIGQGSLQVRLRELDRDDSYEVDTPGGTVLLRAVGRYRIDVTPDGRRTTVTVRDGDADVMVDNNSYPIRQGSSITLLESSSRPTAAERAIGEDDWERWADTRDRREDASTSTQYLPRGMVGYEDLDSYGDWQMDATYGAMWYPRSVAADWAPYRSGRWESVQPWGWTWIDEEPWGFAPFHYGRWSHNRGRWGWIPGDRRAQPVYAPALVAFVSGDNWNVSLSLGSGGGIGWIPLGPREVYVPSYRTSPTYIRNVNSMNVNISNMDVTRLDVNRTQYVNRNVQGAVTVVARDDFRGSRPVNRSAVRVRPGDLETTRFSATPVVSGGGTIAPPPRGSALDRSRPGNAGNAARPPVELPRMPPSQGRGRGRGNDTPPQTQNPPNQDRGRGRGGEPPVGQPPVIPTPPPTRDQGRGRGGEPPTAPPPVIPTPPPTQDRGRGRGRGGEPPTTPPPVVPTPPPTQDRSRGRGRGGEPPTTPPPVIPAPPPSQGRGRGGEPPTTPPPVVPTPPPTRDPTPPPTRDRGRGRGRGGEPPTTPPPVVPTPPPGRGTPPPPPPPTQGRGRGGKPPVPVKPKPDSGRGGGGGLQLLLDR